jgi:hypothetical protein
MKIDDAVEDGVLTFEVLAGVIRERRWVAKAFGRRRRIGKQLNLNVD